MFADALGFTDDQIRGLIPADALPLILAAVLAGTLHGIQDTVRMIDGFLQRQAPRAKPTLGQLVVWVTFHFDQFAIFDEELDAATHGMTAWWRPCTGAGNDGAITEHLRFRSRIVFVMKSHGTPPFRSLPLPTLLIPHGTASDEALLWGQELGAHHRG